MYSITYVYMYMYNYVHNVDHLCPFVISCDFSMYTYSTAKLDYSSSYDMEKLNMLSCF